MISNEIVNKLQKNQIIIHRQSLKNCKNFFFKSRYLFD